MRRVQAEYMFLKFLFITGSSAVVRYEDGIKPKVLLANLSFSLFIGMIRQPIKPPSLVGNS